jgi:hypothetical protein
MGVLLTGVLLLIPALQGRLESRRQHASCSPIVSWPDAGRHYYPRNISIFGRGSRPFKEQDIPREFRALAKLLEYWADTCQGRFAQGNRGQSIQHGLPDNIGWPQLPHTHTCLGIDDQP